MTIDSDKILHDLLNSLDSLEGIRPGEIPNIALYMDQVTTFMDAQLASSRRFESDKVLTKTMINNYAKNKLLPPPVKKKYSPEHMMLLVFKLATTSSTGGLLLALQRAIVTIRPKGRYRKHFCWPAIKRYYSNLLVSILLLALLYTFELLHLLYCQSFQHNIL